MAAIRLPRPVAPAAPASVPTKCAYVHHGMALELLSRLPSGCAGAVITDPPFFVGISRDQGGLGHDPWSKASTMEQIVAWTNPHAREISRVLRPGGALVVMGGSQSLSAWEMVAASHKLNWMAELSILWNTGKPRVRNFGSLMTSARWYAKTGARHAFNSQSRSIYSNILVCNKVPLVDRVHPAQKPVSITNFIVSLLTNYNDLVIDPFCGSGSTLVSAAMCGRRWLGADMDFEYCQVAAHRAQAWELEEEHAQPVRLWVNGKLKLVE